MFMLTFYEGLSEWGCRVNTDEQRWTQVRRPQRGGQADAARDQAVSGNTQSWWRTVWERQTESTDF